MANIKFDAKLKVNLASNTEVEFDESLHLDQLPKKDKVLVALGLGLGLTVMVREYKINGNEGIIISDNSLMEICSKFGIA